MSYLIRRILAKSRLILDEMCRLYGKFASYFSSYKWPIVVLFEKYVFLLHVLNKNEKIISAGYWVFSKNPKKTRKTNLF